MFFSRPSLGRGAGSMQRQAGNARPAQFASSSPPDSPPLWHTPKNAAIASASDYGWRETWVCIMSGVFIYVSLMTGLPLLVSKDAAAVQELQNTVPTVLYQMSATAFFTAMVLNLTSFLFEDSASKRQLALLSCFIKGAACHSDLLVIMGQSLMLYDNHQAVLVTQRYIQWAATTPMMVYILSKISDFTFKKTTYVMLMDVAMVMFGLLSHFLPYSWAWLGFLVSSTLFVAVLYMMGLMVFSAVSEQSSSNSKRSLIFIYMCTLLIWTMFPIAWVVRYLHPHATYQAEVLTLFANFTAKVLFSSSIMYGNYMTIAQRRLIAREEDENRNRIQMVSDLKEAVTRKDQFMSLMSHELRTPLNGIIQLSDALCRGSGGEMNPKGQHFIRTIKNSSNHLLNIINDILDVAALKEGKLTIKHETVNLAKAVDHVVDIVSPLAKKEVAIEKSVNPRTPFIIADFSRLVQILYNLLGNSLKFTSHGHVRVSVEPSKSTDKVIIKVSDTGIGIAKQKIATIWGAFEQVDMSVTRKYGGTGLGLNIVKQLVTAHDGQIAVESVEGQGTTFTITLPVLQFNIRQSLEMQVRQHYELLGYDFEVLKQRMAVNNRGRTSFSTLSRNTYSSMRNSLQDSTEYDPRVGLPLSPAQGGAGTPVAREEGDDGRFKIIRKRTAELEQHSIMSDLMRRTEHKRSLDEAEHKGKGFNGSPSPKGTGMPTAETSSNSPAVAARGHAAGNAPNTWHSSGTMPVHPNRGSSVSSNGTASFSMSVGRHGALPIGIGFECTEEGPCEADAELVALKSLGQFHSQTYGLAAGRSHISSSGIALTLNPGLQVQTLKSQSMGGQGGELRGERSFTSRSEQGWAMRCGIGQKALESELYRRTNDHDEDSGSECSMPTGAVRHWSNRSAGLPKLPGSSNMGSPSHAVASRPPLSHRGSSPGNALLANGLEKLAYSQMYGSVQVLSVDDEEVNQLVLEEILTSVGYQYARAMDGLEALEWLSASETLPDLILLDCMMPNMSGHEFCAVLRKAIPSTVLPVIMVSAKSDGENIVEGLRSGSNDFVRKPYQREELLARIETQLRLKTDSWWLAELVNNQDGRETESMKLLKNILPESIIQRMQQGQNFVADSHQNVTILFSDIVGFTRLSSKLPTAEVFLMLSNLFTAFDKLTDRYAVYKVETIGDAYMAAVGHDEDPGKAAKGPPLERMIAMAKAMIDVVKNLKAPNGESLKIRIGIHCGPAFAGVIGMKCPRFCFLGDTVNTASRMESMSFPMCIQVSGEVAQHWNSPQDVVEVGERDVKGKGRMTTYLLKYGNWEQGLEEYRMRKLSQARNAFADVAADRQHQAAAGASSSPGVNDLTDSDAGAMSCANSPSNAHAPEHVSYIPVGGPLGPAPVANARHASQSGMGGRLLHHLAASLPADSHPSQILASQLPDMAALGGVTCHNGLPLLQAAAANPLDNAVPSASNTAFVSCSNLPFNSGEQAQFFHSLSSIGGSLNGSLRANAATAAVAQGSSMALEQLATLTAQLVQAQEQVKSLKIDIAQEHERTLEATYKMQAAQDAATTAEAAAAAVRQQQQHQQRQQQAQLQQLQAQLQQQQQNAAAASELSKSKHLASPPPSANANTNGPMSCESSSSDLVDGTSCAAVHPTPPNCAVVGAVSGLLSHATSGDSTAADVAASIHGGSRLLLGFGGNNRNVAVWGKDKLMGSNGLPACSLASLFVDLGLDAYLARFESEAIRLDMLLTMEYAQLEALGLRPLGYCIRLRESVIDLARGLLRLCEERSNIYSV